MSSELRDEIKEFMEVFGSEISVTPIFKGDGFEGNTEDLMGVTINVRGPDDSGEFPLNRDTRWSNSDFQLKRALTETPGSFMYRVRYCLYSFGAMFGRGQHYQQTKIQRMLGINQ